MSYLVAMAVFLTVLAVWHLVDLQRNRAAARSRVGSQMLLDADNPIHAPAITRASSIVQMLIRKGLITAQDDEQVAQFISFMNGETKPTSPAELSNVTRSIMERVADGGIKSDHEQKAKAELWLLMDSRSKRTSRSKWRKKFSLERLLVAVVAGWAVALVFSVIRTNLDTYEVPAEQTPPAIATESPIKPTTLQSAETGLGPFKALSASNFVIKTAAPAVLLLGEDGGIQASTSWAIDVNSKTWTDDGSFWVRDVQVNADLVTFKTATDKVFVVGTNQPFMIEVAPDSIIRVDAAGIVHTVSIAQAIQLRVPLVSHSK